MTSVQFMPFNTINTVLVSYYFRVRAMMEVCGIPLFGQNVSWTTGLASQP